MISGLIVFSEWHFCDREATCCRRSVVAIELYRRIFEIQACQALKRCACGVGINFILRHEIASATN